MRLESIIILRWLFRMSIKFEIKPDEFNVEFMKEYGYQRKKCKYCGAYFWTNEPDRDDCGEPPCSTYAFLRNPPTKRRYTVSQMRNAFLKFFERNGHTIIRPYPVVARWRDDLLITIASIADFQPFVTSGISEPPANPLVISQPCLRFEDIHNVGLTAGRHLTIFEMGGAHAFNKRKEKIFYWKNETIKYHHLFAIEELGIPENEIIYKEHFWVGGGNAGPDLEGIIRGLEVSTLVFMQFKVENGKLIETPILTVDTGYGIERWAWLSQGSPTAFHVIYGDIVNEVLKWAGLEIDEQILYQDTFFSGAYKADNMNYVLSKRREIALKYGYNPQTLTKLLSAFNQLMSVLDHSKAAIFLIKDGALPSNVREGYLTRLLLRRLFRVMDRYGIIEYLDNLIKKQIDLWGKDFIEIGRAKNTILEVILTEYERYKKILSKGSDIIKGIISKKKSIDINDLILLYDSYGIPPDYVSDIARQFSIKIDVPPDFHARVAARHQKPQEITKAELKLPIKTTYETQRIYYENPYLTNLQAKVLWVWNNYLILDKTIFYPEGGGQLSDTGYIIKDDMAIRINKVLSIDGNIVHIADETLSGKLKVGDLVTCRIDWDRRYSLMRHHTATHILISAIRRVLGGHVWQAGAEKRPDQARLDITHYKVPSKEEIAKIEFLANEVISRGVDVKVDYLERGEAERKFGPQIYQGGVVPGKYVRIVRVGDWDVEACGGTHVKNTSEISILKILGVERIHEGVIRFTFKAGKPALDLLFNSYEELNNLSKLLGVSRENVLQRVKLLLEEFNAAKRKIRQYEVLIRQYMSEELYKGSEVISGIKVIIKEFDNVEEAIEIGENVEKKYKDFIYVGLVNMERGFSISIFTGEYIRQKGITASRIAEVIKGSIKCGGRGDDRYYRLGGPGKISVDKLWELVRNYVVKE